MITNLPTELLRSFIAIVDAGSMIKATERVFVTPSALSLQIKRLEELIQCPLFLREGTRRLVLSPGGHEMLSFARQILALNDTALRRLRKEDAAPLRIGVVQDFAGPFLAHVIRRFSRLHRDVRLDIRIAESSVLTEAFRSGAMDVVLAATLDDNDTVLLRSACCWMGNPQHIQDKELPLVLLDEPCIFRALALRAVERAGRDYRIVLQTPHLNDLAVALAAGLGLTCRTTQFARHAGCPTISTLLLPDIPQMGFIVLARHEVHPAIKDLEAMIRQEIKDVKFCPHEASGMRYATASDFVSNAASWHDELQDAPALGRAVIATPEVVLGRGL